MPLINTHNNHIMNLRNLLSVTFAAAALAIGASDAKADETWKPIGQGTLRDDMVTVYYNTSGFYEFPVEMEESEQTPGRYRLVNAYLNYPLNLGGEPLPDDVTNYIVVDASDPEHVYIERGNTGIAIGLAEDANGNEVTSWMCIMSTSFDYFEKYGNWMIADNEGICGKMVDGTITFPSHQIVVTGAFGPSLIPDKDDLWIRANTHGQFRLKIPTALDTDIELSLTGINAAGTEVSYTIAPDQDVEYVKVGLFEGDYTPDMRAKVENDEVATQRVESLGTVTFPYEKDGLYTLVAVPYAGGRSYAPSTLTSYWQYSEAEWRNVGKAQYTEAILSSNTLNAYGFYVDEYQYQVECQQNVENPSRVRLVDPYGPDCYPRATSTTYDSSRHYYLTFDLTHYNCVHMEHSESIGLNLGVGEMSVRSNSDLYMNDNPLMQPNLTLEEYMESGAPRGYYDPAKRAVTFDADAIRIKFSQNPGAWYEGNKNQHFLLVLPEGIEIPEDHSGIAGIESDNNAPAEYYTLDGIRVAPEQARQGLYIIRQGSKTRKVMLK